MFVAIDFCLKGGMAPFLVAFVCLSLRRPYKNMNVLQILIFGAVVYCCIFLGLKLTVLCCASYKKMGSEAEL